MKTNARTFSESWHRVADLKVSIRPTVTARRQYFRGKKWYVLYDDFNNQFFRLTPEAHDFLARLDPNHTVEEIWHECLERFPDEAPGQEDVIHLLTQLYHANLLYFDGPADSRGLFERYHRRRQREMRAKLLSVMFVHIPLFDPESLLKRFYPMIRWLVSIPTAILWTVVMAAALKQIFDHFGEVASQFQGVLAPGNLFLLYAGLVVIKTVHECGHAVVCKRFGGQVHTMGVMLLVFTPLPYMDATSSWSFRSRWHRALTGAAGMMTELFVAAMAALVWSRTGPGVLHALCYNIMFIASVSTVLFNANPLLRFDGYYMLSDLLEIPNLHTRSRMQLCHLVEHYLFGYANSQSPAHSTREAVWLTVFGILSGLYRVVVFTGIVLFVADKYLLAGLVMAVVCIASWVMVPAYRLLVYLATSPKLARTRLRAASICLGGALVVLAGLGIIPWPDRFRAPGVIESVPFTHVMNDAPGYVQSIPAKTGETVGAQDVLMVLVDRELDYNIGIAEAQKRETLAMEKRAMNTAAADLQPIRKRLETIHEKLEKLYRRCMDLTVRAEHEGVWVCPDRRRWLGTWVERGTDVGALLNPYDFRFSAVVSQDEAGSLFDQGIRSAQVRLKGQSGVVLAVRDLKILPFHKERLPSAALGWKGGGDVAVAATDDSGLTPIEPFFLIYASIVSQSYVKLLHHRTGLIRLDIGQKPLMFQWIRKIRQLLQRRYRI